MVGEKIFGWNGKILRVNLTKEKIAKEPLSQEILHGFIGGRGLNIKVLFDEIRPGIDPLGPENVLCLASGPLVGTSLPNTSRIEVSSLSPYSNILGDGSAGGFFPTYMKLAGYDQIVFTGRATKPKYLLIDDDDVKLKDASEFWGTTTHETTDRLQEEHGKDFRVACIGQAGGNLVRFASTIFDKGHSAARGSGAVWGSKNLKAIAVRGTKKIEIARPDEFSELVKMDRDFLLHDEFHQKVLSVYGTHYGFMHWSPMRKNYRSFISPEEVPHELTPDGMKKYERGRWPCYGCVTPCGQLYEVPTGKYATKGWRLEFETMACCGSNIGIMNPEAMYKIDNLADQYGMCTIPLGYVIAVAKELYEKGIITKEDTGGISLDWDDVDTTIDLIHMIAKREGFGDRLAEGQYNFTKLIGREAMKYCIHSKGVGKGVPYSSLVGLLFATSTRGADHLRGNLTGDNSPYNIEILQSFEERGIVPKDTAEKAVLGQRAFLIGDILMRCKCGLYTWPLSVPLVFQYPIFDGTAKLISAATGWDINEKGLMEVLDRIYNLERAFIVRQGISRKHDNYPLRPEMVGTTAAAEKLKEHEALLDSYYRARGWEVKTGIPTRETLEKLGLKYVADELEKNMPYPEWEGPPLEKIGT